ncbi:MAG: hypothetical protein DWQ01_11665 [Planctomycetota bacterium]|nr:MAG: hypothetical protein DWQ01_11665 [Planctomycetota bacterium]
MAHTRCPHCQTAYKIPDTRLGANIRCKQCQQVFQAEEVASQPRSTAGEGQRRRRRQAPASVRAQAHRRKTNPLVPIMLVVVGIGMFYGLYVAFQGSQKTPQKDPEVEAQLPEAGSENSSSSKVDPLHHPAMRSLRYARMAIQAYNFTSLEERLAAADFYQREGEPSGHPWRTLSRQEQQEYAHALAQRLAEDPAWRELAEQEPTFASLDLEQGDRLEFTVRSSALPQRIWKVNFLGQDGEFRLAGMTAEEDLPEVVEVEEETTPEEKGIQEKFVELTGEDGSKGRVLRGKIEKVDLLEETNPSQAREMKQLVNEVLDSESLAAERQLVDLRPHSIPVVLNRLVDLPLTDDPARVMQLANLDSLLQKISGRNSMFPRPGMTSLQDAQEIRNLRQTALESWFGWWDQWDQRWNEWIEEAGLPKPDPRRRRPRG